MELKNLTWPDVDALDRELPVVIPIAALEQHGRHMPVFTDSLLLEEIIRRAKSHFEHDALFVPLMWLGSSHHHMDFPGTVSADPRVYLDLLTGLADNFIDHGFQRILLINGHGGNDVPARQALFELRQRYRSRSELLLLSATYWHLADPGAGRNEFKQSEMGHAGEWETSMILALDPSLVRGHESVSETKPGNPFLPAARAWTMPDRSRDGYVGVPSAANADKGEQLFEVFAQGVVDLIRRIIRWDGNSWDG